MARRGTHDDAIVSIDPNGRGNGLTIRHGRRRQRQYHFMFGLLTLILCLRRACSQQIGVTICGCQPATYTFTLDFALTCEETTVEGPGINETACLTEIRGQDEVPDEELVPISVQNVQIFELDQNLKVVAQTVRAGSFVNGSNFTYTSIISTMSGSLNPTSLPRGLQLVITGLNRNEETVVNTYIILYTNDCGIFPILTEGQTAGWTIFSDLGDPPNSVCPIAPTLEPTLSPVEPLSNAPTVSPVVGETNAPIEAPVTPGTPTRAPSTGAPATTPTTKSPVVEPGTPTCPPISQGKGYESKSSSSKAGKGYKSKQSGKSGKGKGGKGESSKSGSKGTLSRGDAGKGIKRERSFESQRSMEKISANSSRRLGVGEREECPEPVEESRSSKGKGDNSLSSKGKGSKSSKGKGSKSSKGKGSKSSKGKGSKSSKGKGLEKKSKQSTHSKAVAKLSPSSEDSSEGKGKSGKGSSTSSAKSGKGANPNKSEGSVPKSHGKGKGKGGSSKAGGKSGTNKGSSKAGGSTDDGKNSGRANSGGDKVRS